MKKKILIFLFLFIIQLPIIIVARDPVNKLISLKSEKKELPKVSSDIDKFYDSLVGLKVANILQYKEINTPSGNKGLIIWKVNNCIFGMKFNENISGISEKELVEADNYKLGLVALKFFFNEKGEYNVRKSKFETMHDYKVTIQAVVRGEKMNKEFFASQIWNNNDFLAQIARLCQDIIYDHQGDARQ